MNKFHDKIAVITGAASGIGAAIAKECAKKNMKIVLADINCDKLLKLKEELKDINENIIAVVTDVIPIMLKQIEDCYIVNTASGAGLHTAPNMTGYMATKHAVVALSEVLYFDLEQRKVNINISVLCPGMVVSALTDSMQVNENAPQEVKDQADYLKKSIKAGMSGQEVARQVFAAIEANQFYILTHYDEHKILIENRMRNLLNKHNPTMVATDTNLS